MNLGPWTDDRSENIEENFELLSRQLDIVPEHFKYGKQVHGAATRFVDSKSSSGPESSPEVDAQVTTQSGIAPTVFVADCIPVLLLSKKAVGAVHAGWRGTVDGVIQSAVNELVKYSPVDQVSAVIGPGIGPCCFEVGPEVQQRFSQFGAAVSSDGRVDLKAAVKATLNTSGIDQIHDVDLCTSCHSELFFSYRRDGSKTGRQVGAAWLN